MVIGKLVDCCSHKHEVVFVKFSLCPQPGNIFASAMRRLSFPLSLRCLGFKAPSVRVFGERFSWQLVFQRVSLQGLMR